MEWESLFTEKDLKLGRKLSDGGNVVGLFRLGNKKISAAVMDKENCVTNVDFSNMNEPVFECSCKKGKKGQLCEHAVAVLYEEIKTRKENPNLQEMSDFGEGLNPDAQIEENKDKIVKPFKNIVSNEQYTVYNLENIMGQFNFTDEAYNNAKSDIKNKKISIGAIKSDYCDENRYKRVVAAGYYKDNNRKWPLEVAFNDEVLLSCNCGVDGCKCSYSDNPSNRWYISDAYDKRPDRICRHILGFMLMLQVLLMKRNIGDATDRGGEDVIKGFRDVRQIRRIKGDEEVLRSKSVTLEPKIIFEKNGIYAQFKVGTDRLYICKNLKDLIDIVEAKEILALGKSSFIDFAENEFNEESMKFYYYIWDIVKTQENRIMEENEDFEVTGAKIKPITKIRLIGKKLDEFYELTKGLRISMDDKISFCSSNKFRISQKNPLVTISIHNNVDSLGIFHGIKVKGNLPLIIQGMKYSFYKTKNHLYRVDDGYMEVMEPFYDALDYATGEFEIYIGRKNLSEFYYRILPTLTDYVTIDEPDEDVRAKYLPKRAEFAFYLDAEQGDVFCDARVLYGDLEYSLCDEKHVNAYNRDIQFEKEIIDLITIYFPEIDEGRKAFSCGKDKDLIYSVLESGVGNLMNVGQVNSTDAFRSLKIHNNVKLSLGVSVTSNIMDLEIQSEEFTQDELLDILQSYKKKKKYYRLKNGDFLGLSQESLGDISQMLDSLHLSPGDFVKGKMQLPVYRALYLDKLLEENSDIYAKRDKEYKALVKQFKTVADSEYDIPANLHKIMRGYQRYGHRWLRTIEKNHFGGILADDMGLGKTLQVISVLLADKIENGNNGTSFVVAPASLVYNWQEEIKKFAPELSVVVVAGKQEERTLLIEEYDNYDVMITSYDLLKRDISSYEGKQFNYQIIDEAQYIKNHTTAAAKSVKVIKSRTKFALTGTPIENRLSELWSIFDYLMPGFLYDYETFRNEIEIPIVRYQDKDALKQLKRMVSPFILRRLKKEVLKDLPEKMEEIRYAKMDAKQQSVYDGQVVYMKNMLKTQTNESFNKNRMQMLAELMKTRQICCDPGLVLENYEGESAKRQACLELVKSAIEGEHKMLIFSQFTSMLELLEKDLNKENIAYYKITGETPKEERMRLVNEFNDDDTPVFLISLKAGGTGLNLTGADVVIHYDPWWNVAVMNQATDRAHRLGQKNVVSVYKLIVKGSIEEKILKLQEAKQDLADQILSGELGNISSLSRDEFIELLS
ncbi:MAG: SNF2 helicase associated domain-containing protein [Agathobacter sp.]|nr:SNF2 helicase associated domain-containing protein [Agathobacter sp.]